MFVSLGKALGGRQLVRPATEAGVKRIILSARTKHV